MEDEWSRGGPGPFIGIKDFIAASSSVGRIHFCRRALVAILFLDAGARLDSSARAQSKQINEAV